MKNSNNALCRLGMLIFLISLTLPVFGDVITNILVEDEKRVTEYYKECMEIKDYGIKDEFQVSCFRNYHHFNATSFKLYKSREISKDIKISSFNVLHPGSNASFFKDYEILAKIMNRYDLVTAQELLPLVSKDQKSNERVVKFLGVGSQKLAELKKQRERSADNSLDESVEELEKDLIHAKDLYRVPGYLKILVELRKIDPSWSLLLSPAGDAAKKRSVHEFVGFYYRGKVVTPKVNEHCQSLDSKSSGEAVACFPKMSKDWLGRNVRQVFSRRPFMGSFISGKFDFTVFTTHISFNAPKEEDVSRSILEAAFGVSDYQDVGDGVNAENYARFAEVKVILEIMSKIRSESKEKDIMFMGDLNLESTNLYWDNILPLYPNLELYVDEPTTISSQFRRSDGSKTNGLASNFDHVLLDPTVTSNCLSDNGKFEVKVDSFITDNGLVESKYLLREGNGLSAVRDFDRKSDGLLKMFENYVSSLFTVKRNKVVIDFTENELKEDRASFKRRILDEQFKEDSFYKIYKETVSDHLPISFKCKTL